MATSLCGCGALGPSCGAFGVRNARLALCMVGGRLRCSPAVALAALLTPQLVGLLREVERSGGLLRRRGFLHTAGARLVLISYGMQLGGGPSLAVSLVWWRHARCCAVIHLREGDPRGSNTEQDQDEERHTYSAHAS